MQVPILNGVYANTKSDFRTSYPRNMIPVPKIQGISQGYLRPADGIELFTDTGIGFDRGGINWKGSCYRVSGQQLVKIDEFANTTVIGYVGGSGQVTLDYSFDKLAIASGGSLYYYDGSSSLSKVTDADLGYVKDVVWVDGYFMTTDGTSIVVTELNDPMSVNPLKYGSSESDPDNVIGLLKLRNEIYVLNRHTIEVFQNVGGEFFPFERVEGAMIQRGAIGTFAAAVFLENIAFVGGGRNESPAVWIGSNSSSAKISTREIDQVLASYTEEQLTDTVVEVRVSDGHQFLYVHLPDGCWVYDGMASQIVEEPVWFNLTSGVGTTGQYRAKNFVWCYDRWICGDPTSSKVGLLTPTSSHHYGEKNSWEFSTALVYNNGFGAIVHQLELVAITGNVPLGVDPVVTTSHSVDGMTWSLERPVKAGKIGERTKRLVWFQQGHFQHWRSQRFRGTSDCHISVARLELQVEPLNV